MDIPFVEKRRLVVAMRSQHCFVNNKRVATIAPLPTTTLQVASGTPII